MRKVTILFISTILITLSCSKAETDIRLAEFDTPVLTGFELRDEQGSPMGVIGTPNIKLGSFLMRLPWILLNDCWISARS